MSAVFVNQVFDIRTTLAADTADAQTLSQLFAGAMTFFDGAFDLLIGYGFADTNVH
jgi:hypothetical protein